MIHARHDYNRIQDPYRLIPQNEPVFLLRGQDVLAPETVRKWTEAYRLLHGSDPLMASLAWQHADLMMMWQKNMGSKVPDMSEAQITPSIPHAQAPEEIQAAFARYKSEPEFYNAVKWARTPEHTEGSMWAAFNAGYLAAKAEAGDVQS